jgi:hypothetical protein
MSAVPVPEPVIHREEAIGLLFNVANVVDLLTEIRDLLEDDEEEDES